jgi:hypothetical protein
MNNSSLHEPRLEAMVLAEKLEPSDSINDRID